MQPVRAKDHTDILTIGELCEALSDGALSAEQDGDYYTFSVRELHRFVDRGSHEKLLELFDSVVLQEYAIAH